jgi:hypothetical protein
MWMDRARKQNGMMNLVGHFSHGFTFDGAPLANFLGISKPLLRALNRFL